MIVFDDNAPVFSRGQVLLAHCLLFRLARMCFLRMRSGMGRKCGGKAGDAGRVSGRGRSGTRDSIRASICELLVTSNWDKWFPGIPLVSFGHHLRNYMVHVWTRPQPSFTPLLPHLLYITPNTVLYQPDDSQCRAHRLSKLAVATVPEMTLPRHGRPLKGVSESARLIV